MTFQRILLTYVISVPVFFVIDMIWRGVIARGFYRKALEPLVTRSFLSVPGGMMARQSEASATFGPVIRAGLAAKEVYPGTAEYESFFLVWQTVLDSADPINWAAEAAANTPVMLHEVINDQVIPNFVPTSPLAGTEPLIKVMGLNAYSSTQQSADGLRSAGRFLPPADHGSWLNPSASLAATVEMQKQVISFIGSLGGAVIVTDPSTMVPVMTMESQETANLTEKKSSKSVKGKNKPGRGTISRLEQVKSQTQPGRLE